MIHPPGNKLRPARNWSAEFNALPEEARVIGSVMEARIRIQMLGFEKDRLKRDYRRALMEIAERIKVNKDWLKQLEEE